VVYTLGWIAFAVISVVSFLMTFANLDIIREVGVRKFHETGKRTSIEGKSVKRIGSERD